MATKKVRQNYFLSFVVAVGSRIGIREKSWSGINIPDPQHRYKSTVFFLQALKQFHEVLGVGRALHWAAISPKSRTQISSDASCAELRSKVSGWHPYVLPAAFSKVLDPKLAGSFASGRLLLKSLGLKQDEKLGDEASAVWNPKTCFGASRWTGASWAARACCPCR